MGGGGHGRHDLRGSRTETFGTRGPCSRTGGRETYAPPEGARGGAAGPERRGEAPGEGERGDRRVGSGGAVQPRDRVQGDGASGRGCGRVPPFPDESVPFFGGILPACRHARREGGDRRRRRNASLCARGGGRQRNRKEGRPITE